MKKSRRPTMIRLAALTGAVCVAGPLFAQTPAPTTSVEIFGDMSLGVVRQSGTNAPRYQEVSSLAWANSFGFRGREDLGGGTQAIFAIVTSPGLDVGASGNAAAFWKNTYVGLSDSTWGTVMFGRNDELMSTLCPLDIMCLRGIIQGLRPGNIDRVGGAQLSNMVRYNSPEFGPFRFKAYAVLGEGTTTPNGKAEGLQADFRQGDLVIAAAHEKIRSVSITPGSPATGLGVTSFFGNAAGPATAFVLDQMVIDGLGARYNFGQISLFALATRVNMQYQGQHKPYKSYNLGAAYNMNTPLEFAGGCSRMTFDPSNWTSCQLRVTYNFSKRTSVFVADVQERSSGAFAKPQLFIEGGSGSLGGSTNVFAVGVRHIF